jgi:hypothetical protein
VSTSVGAFAPRAANVSTSVEAFAQQSKCAGKDCKTKKVFTFAKK